MTFHVHVSRAAIFYQMRFKARGFGHGCRLEFATIRVSELITAIPHSRHENGCPLLLRVEVYADTARRMLDQFRVGIVLACFSDRY